VDPGPGRGHGPDREGADPALVDRPACPDRRGPPLLQGVATVARARVSVDRDPRSPPAGAGDRSAVLGRGRPDAY